MGTRVIRPIEWVITGFLLATSGQADEPAAFIQFQESLIADQYGYAFGTSAADFDRDGDMDLTSSDTRLNALYWHENDGHGKFQRHSIQENETGWFERHAIGDLNGDQRPDVVVVKNLDGHIVWFENRIGAAEGAGWLRHVVTTDLPRAYDVTLADFNGDGRLDVAASSWTGNQIAWFANPEPAATEREWQKQPIDLQLAESRTIRAADFNQDGKPDLLATGRSANLTVWYEQTGKTGDSWRRHVVDAELQQPVHGQPSDLDGDGDLDIVLALGMHDSNSPELTNRIVWYENVGKPGRGLQWKRHAVGDLVGAFEAVTADLDGDGDLDLVATAWGGAGQVVWFENAGDARTWKQHLVKDHWPRANQPVVVDLDGDQRLDIAATAEKGSNELRWWRNTIPAKP